MIGILTLPMRHNYGGIIQAYALQYFLERNGYDCLIINIQELPPKFLSFHNLINILKRFILRYILGKKNVFLSPKILYKKRIKNLNIIFKKNIDFINKYLKKTKPIMPITEINNINFNTYIVGSDQVWRPIYTPYLPHYFLDFVKNNNTIKIAYAASFGIDNGREYKPDMLAKCQELIKNFNAVSVREDSGVKLCRELFGVNAIHVIDPALLLNSEDYIKLFSKCDDLEYNCGIFSYILDNSEIKDNIIEKISNITNLKYFQILPKAKLGVVGEKRISECVVPSIEQWLKSFYDAKFVVADSFHGCVFSIIFKKNFIVIGNCERGMARFSSLLKLFKLQKRLVSSVEDVTEELVNENINYAEIYEILEKERDKAKQFLFSALNNELNNS